MKDQIIEVLARAICKQKGVNPDATCLSGPDPFKPRWKLWQARAEISLAALEAAGYVVGKKEVQANSPQGQLPPRYTVECKIHRTWYDKPTGCVNCHYDAAKELPVEIKAIIEKAHKADEVSGWVVVNRIEHSLDKMPNAGKE